MSEPRELEWGELTSVSLSPRFALEQGSRYHVTVAVYMDWAPTLPGVKTDGSAKVRPIDDMTASAINQATSASEKLRYDTLGGLVVTLRELANATQV